MKHPKIDVSVIIVNYNTLSLTKQCIESIYSHTHDVSYEIIVVDNASSDGSVEYLSNDNRVIFISSKSNLGFGRANNLGYSQAHGKYIFLLNSDTILNNNAIKYYYDFLESAPQQISCVGAILYNADGEPTHSYGTFPSICTTIHNILIYAKLLKSTHVVNKTPPFKVDYITGADLFIRRDVVEKYGLFDEDFFMYFEETELQYRYNMKGYESWIIPGPEIVHLEGASSSLIKNKPSQRFWLMYYTGMFTYMKKRYSRIKYIIFRLIVLLYVPIVLRAKGDRNLDVLKLFFFGAK